MAIELKSDDLLVKLIESQARVETKLDAVLTHNTTIDARVSALESSSMNPDREKHLSPDELIRVRIWIEGKARSRQERIALFVAVLSPVVAILASIAVEILRVLTGHG